MSAQTQPQQAIQSSPAEKYARWRRRDHSNLEAMQNLIFDAVSVESGIEFKPRLRSFISALQSAHGGGEVINEPFERSHKTIASYLQFTGTDETKAARVRRLINELEDFQNRSGYRFYWITRGGNPTGEKDEHGNDLYSATEYIDLVKPVADDAVVAARESEQWKGDKTKGIKAHPGLALAAQVSWALSKLPRINVQTDAPVRPESRPLSVSEYREMRDPRLLGTIEKWADGIRERKGDDDLALEWLEVQVKRIRESRLKTRNAREDDEPLLAMEQSVNATANTSYKTDRTVRMTTASHQSRLEVPAPTILSPLTAESSNEVNDLENESEPNMLEWALLWAERGIPVFPLHEVYDGICTCSCSDHWRKREGRWVMECAGGEHFCGSECSNKGKHPRTDRKLGMVNGLKSATTDPEVIKAWWGKYPTANIGGRMLRKLGIDVDPKHGGDISIHDLCERYGQEWLDGAWRNVSGSGGPHFIFDNPTGISFKNSASKIGPGIDTRGDEGYLVMPPSIHVSGERYRVISPAEFPPVPQFIIDLLNAPKVENGIDYQENSSRGGGVGKLNEKFLDGHRNDGLLAYGLGRMRWAWERTEEEFYAQLSKVNQLRCVPPLDDDEVRDLAAHIAYDYAHLYGVNIEQEAA